MLTKREVVKATLAHQDVGEIPYFINFTPDALEVVQPRYPGPDFSVALGNYVHWIRPPWWTWHEIPESYRCYEDPGWGIQQGSHCFFKPSAGGFEVGVG